jgi:hypothetical protein
MTGATRERPRRPWPIAIAAAILVVLALLQVPVGGLFVSNQGELAAAIAAAYPQASPAEIGDRTAVAIAEGIGVHAITAIVYLASAWTLRTQGSAVRIFVTALAAIAMLTDGLILGQLPRWLPGQTGLIHAVWALSTALRLVAIGLLWLPASARTWFAGK